MCRNLSHREDFGHFDHKVSIVRIPQHTATTVKCERRLPMESLAQGRVGCSGEDCRNASHDPCARKTTAQWWDIVGKKLERGGSTRLLFH
mmetsp:Transcript_8334/g.11665  ORF Transcript_8334/g.11665 Transcript_8334/m.11665 type:complete len:90 (+) Transcript_8334:560-829(+)